jgi:putative N6-adenine-specific DNA methylase
MARHDYLAVVAPGLAATCARECAALGLDVVAHDDAGVAFRGDAAAMRRANLWLRTASRVTRRLGAFEARGFAELERRAARLPWADVLVPGMTVALRVSSRKSKLYHTGAIAERLHGVLADAIGARPADAPPADDDVGAEAPSAVGALVIVRVHRDAFTVSADTSGPLLHRRGYRLATAKAPMRETLAAALLLAAGYDGTGPLVDPMAGSGTIGIEGAMLARGIAPGIARSFAFERWPDHDAAAWDAERAGARAAARDRAPNPIVANDRDPGAVAAITANAERAGVRADLDVRQGPASAVALPQGTGWIVTNPPYGRRITGGADVRDLYASLGRSWRAQAPGWTAAVVCAEPSVPQQLGLSLDPAVQTRNGGLPVAFAIGRIPETP